MFAVLRVVSLVLGVVILGFAPAARADLSGADRSAAIAAIVAARDGDWGHAYADIAAVKDTLPLKVVQWIDYTRTNSAGRFAEIAAFIARNPDWPGQKVLRRRAEQALASESDATAAAWFERHPPISAMGHARAAQILLDDGKIVPGTAALRTAWIDGDFTTADEAGFWTRYQAMLRPQDNAARLDRLLWDDRIAAARRMLKLVSPGERALAEARLALAAEMPDAETTAASVPAELRTDPGLRFDELRWQRKKDNIDAAAQMLLASPGDPVHPASFWVERQIVARRLLASGQPAEAYRIVEQHGAIAGSAYCEAQFLAGFIALRYMKNPALAFDHFSHILTRATTPFSQSRAAYWGGRAAAAEGKAALATKWYAAGADHMATFYGQLAAHELGRDAPPHPQPEPHPDAAERARFNASLRVRATQLFFDAGDRVDARLFLLRLTRDAQTPVGFAMLADLAQSHGRIDLAIAVARRAVDAGMPLTTHGYPVTPIPRGGTAERALLYAIVRQESAFDLDAVSRAGALGLMQLMPTTASYIAGKMQVPFNSARLTLDGEYNLLLGRDYLEQLLGDFGGSYALAIAAYNAGPNRVRQWLQEYGDPRGRQIDMVDWLELIPYAETRNYVQRVLENLQIYRAQIGDKSTAFSLVSDLAR